MQRIPRIIRITQALLTIAAAAAVTTIPLQAQVSSPTSRFEARAFVGGLIPTGNQADVLGDSFLAGLQAGWSLHPNVVATASLGWAPSEDKTALATLPSPRTGQQETVDVYQIDLGIEARYPVSVLASWVATPYVGVGGGARSYRFRDIDGMAAQTNPLGFGALGLDIARSSQRIGVRLEVRDNITGFKALRDEVVTRKTRNDVQISLGVRYGFTDGR